MEVSKKEAKISPKNKKLLIEWIPEMSVGEETIDQQHQKIINLVNELASFEFDGTNAVLDKLRKIIHFLHEYVSQHFSYEEAYMLKYHYPHLKEHQKIHHRFEQTSDKIKDKLNNILYVSPSSIYAVKDGLNALVHECRLFLIDWWNHHILHEDHSYSHYIGEQKIAKRKNKS